MYYVFGMNRIYLEQEKSSRYRLQNTVWQRITEQYQQSERLRHDMKNHIVALSALFQNKEWEKMGDYLKKMGDSGMDAGGDLTGNKAVDALLYQKRKKQILIGNVMCRCQKEDISVNLTCAYCLETYWTMQGIWI